ncbi:MAG: DUF2784 domain-containing protein [Thiotrichales bacterium]|nr:DUF2784 domain-containing protein [Thiotrichales bacterium]
MDNQTLYLLAADSILLLHVLFVVFVVMGLVLVIVGKHYDWSWVLNPWFRIAHLGAIIIVVCQSWLGVLCPLTVWEINLRRLAGDAVYPGSFISHWLETLLYYQAPDWVFVVVYTLFGTVVVLSWILIPPRRSGSGN